MDTVVADSVVLGGIILGKWVAYFIFGLFLRNAIREIRSAPSREWERVKP